MNRSNFMLFALGLLLIVVTVVLTVYSDGVGR